MRSKWRAISGSLVACTVAGPALAQTAEAPPAPTPDPNDPFNVVRTLSREGGDKRGRILLGSPADYSSNNWQVALVLDEQPDNFRAQFCGGIYLGGRWVVTAAHCVEYPVDLYKVLSETGDLDKPGRRTTVLRKVVPEKYRPGVRGHDIALLELAGPLLVTPIPLITQADVAASPSRLPKPGDKLRVTGWGVTGDAGKASPILLQGEPPLQTWTTCNDPVAYNGRVKVDQICAGFPTGGPDACKGDSGGPATVDVAGVRKLYGIVSWGEKCGQPARYGVYTRISAHFDFITAAMASPSPVGP